MDKWTIGLLCLLIVGILVLAGCGTGEAVNIGASSKVILKNEIFALTDANGNFHLYQYKGADDLSSANPKMAFKNLGTGDSIIKDYVYQSDAEGIGIKRGAVLNVGSSAESAKDYYALIAPSKSKKSDMPINIAYDPKGKEIKHFAQTVSVKI